MKTLNSWKTRSSIGGAILLGLLAALPAYATNYPTLVLGQAPIDYWRLNETNPSPARNIVANLGSTGSAGTGYIAAGALTGQPGIIGNSVQLINTGDVVGNCDTRVDIPNLPALNPQAPFTIEFWAKPTSLSADGTGLCIVSSLSPFPGGGSRSGYLFYVNTAGWTFRLGGENSYTATAKSASAGTTNWTHIIGEFDGTTARLYVNGVLSGSGVASPSAPFFPNQWVPTRIGGTALPGGEYADANGNIQYGEGNRGYDGYFDEFAVYNTLLSSNTIASHYATATTNPAGYGALVMASSPVGYWNMDEPAFTPPSPSTYTFAADLGSLGDNGTNTLGTLADQPGVPGLSADARSVYYNGAVGSLVLNTNETQPAFGALPITLAAWIKPNSFGYVEDIIAQGYNESTYVENYLRVADTYDWQGQGNPDVPYYEVGTYDGGAAYNNASFPAPAGDIGHWVFLVGTYDGTQWNLYRNGVLVSQFADGGTGPTTSTDPWSVGSRSNPNPYFGFFFDGSIEEASIFTNALGADVISNLYNSVALPPVITLAPQAPSPAYLGSSATFSVLGDGPGTLTYQWTSNTVALSGQTTTNLTLTGLTAAADATYSVIVSSPYGSVTDSVVLVVTPTLPPVTLVPASETRWIGSPLAFAPASLPNQQLSFQWNFDQSPISGATNSSYTATTTAGSVGSYTLVITNTFGGATSSVAVLTTALTPPNNYVATILNDQPLAYFRLDETNGTVAHDYAGGNDGHYYGSVLLGQPGYSLIDPDPAVNFPGLADSYVGDIGPTTINFPGASAEFTIEAWANGAAGQIDGAAVIAKGEGNVGATTATEQFAIGVSSGNYRFFVRDSRGNIAEADANSGPDGTWHHLVGVCDGAANNLTFYIDGVAVASAAPPTAGIRSSTAGVSIGAERSGVLPTYDWAYNGTIDEVAIYPSALSAAKVEAHYAAAYGSNLAPFITLQPASITNYITLPVTLKVSAAGSVPLAYQWNKVGSGPIAGATGNSLTIPNLAASDAGTYTVGITNSVSGILSTPVTISVLQPPTSPPAISGLVMHLTFDDTLVDATGRGNNATNEASGGAPLLTNDYVPGVIGQAFTYQTTVDSSTTNANYASVGVRPDLQFGSNVSFTVSMWVQLPGNYVGNDLPFFCDVKGSTFGYPGFCFEPSFGQTVGATAGWPGGWGFSVFDNTDVGIGVYGDVGSINDGNFHNLIYVIDRTAGATVYLDGVAAHQNRQSGTSVAGIGNIDSTNSATIGQDPTGLYAQPGTANIDDLGVWRKALSPLEAASIYMAAISNQLSFVSAPTSVVLTPTLLPGRELELTWSAGTLQSSSNLLGPWTTLSNATSPYTNTPSGATFYRLKE